MNSIYGADLTGAELAGANMAGTNIQQRTASPSEERIGNVGVK